MKDRITINRVYFFTDGESNVSNSDVGEGGVEHDRLYGEGSVLLAARLHRVVARARLDTQRTSK